jgi:hypothetical protein
MASAPSIHAAEPACPVLAQSLLTKPECRATYTEEPSYEAEQNQGSNLKDDWDTGIQPNNSRIFRCGAVIGFSRLRSRSRDTDEYIGQVKNSV